MAIHTLTYDQILIKLNEVESVLRTIANTNHKPQEVHNVKKQVKKLEVLRENLKNRAKLITEATVPATVSYKGNMPDKVLKVDPTDIETIQNIKTDPNIDHASIGNKKLKEEAGLKYTREESLAVGKEVAKSLIKVMRAQGDEIKAIKLTGLGTNKFSIHVEYGQDKGKDTFHFKLNPETQSVSIDLGNTPQELSKFLITQGNEVSITTPELEDTLSDVLVKYIQTTPEIDETIQKVGSKYVTYPEKGGHRLGTFASKKAAEKQLTAIHIKQHQKEALDPVGQEDDDINNDGKVDKTDKYLKHRRDVVSKNLGEDLDIGHEDDEPGMLKADVYKILQDAKQLYLMLSRLEGQGEIDFPHWWQAKIVNARACLAAANNYLEYEMTNIQQTSTEVLPAENLNEKKGTCCHKCGHTHVKGTSHPTPYNTGKSNCKYRD